MTSTDTVERVAKAMAWDRRNVHDACEDADEYWAHTGDADKDDWRGTARAAISAMPSPDVGEARLAAAVDKLGFRKLVAGWNGEDREGEYDPHPDKLGVTLKTTAGVVYEIDAARRTLSTPPKEDV